MFGEGADDGDRAAAGVAEREHRLRGPGRGFVAQQRYTAGCGLPCESVVLVSAEQPQLLGL